MAATAAANIALVGLGLLTGVLLARLLGPDGRGMVAAVTLWPSLLLTLGGLGVPHTIAYFVARAPGEARRVYLTALRCAALQSAILIAVGFVLLPRVLGGEFAEAVTLGCLYLVAIPLSLGGGIAAGVLQGLLCMGRHGLHRVVPTLIYAGGLVALAMAGLLRPETVVAVLLLSLLGSFLCGAWLVRRTAAADPALVPEACRSIEEGSQAGAGSRGATATPGPPSVGGLGGARSSP